MNMEIERWNRYIDINIDIGLDVDTNVDAAKNLGKIYLTRFYFIDKIILKLKTKRVKGLEFQKFRKE